MPTRQEKFLMQEVSFDIFCFFDPRESAVATRRDLFFTFTRDFGPWLISWAASRLKKIGGDRRWFLVDEVEWRWW
jgi:hypothetical protein